MLEALQIVITNVSHDGGRLFSRMRACSSSLIVIALGGQLRYDGLIGTKVSRYGFRFFYLQIVETSNQINICYGFSYMNRSGSQSLCVVAHDCTM